MKNETITLWLQETKRKKEQDKKKKKLHKKCDSTIGKIFTLAKIFVRHPTVENPDATGGGVIVYPAKMCAKIIASQW